MLPFPNESLYSVDIHHQIILVHPSTIMDYLPVLENKTKQNKTLTTLPWNKIKLSSEQSKVERGIIVLLLLNFKNIPSLSDEKLYSS